MLYPLYQRSFSSCASCSLNKSFAYFFIHSFRNSHVWVCLYFSCCSSYFNTLCFSYSLVTSALNSVCRYLTWLTVFSGLYHGDYFQEGPRLKWKVLEYLLQFESQLKRLCSRQPPATPDSSTYHLPRFPHMA